MLFAWQDGTARALQQEQVAKLQAFFEANPEYFLSVAGAPPAANEAQHEFDDLPPAELPFRQRWMIGFENAAGELFGMASVLGDFIAPGVWHLGLFIVASRWHGSGMSARTHDALVAWMRDQGAQWIRLGVVVGNTKAERFWEKMGYLEVRRREAAVSGETRRELRVMVKALAAEPLSSYLNRVARDRPEP